MAWTMWRKATKHEIAKRDAKMKAISMMRNMLIWKAWATWRTHCDALAHGHAHAEEKLLAHKRRCELVLKIFVHVLQ